jgi:hypothetical protein
VKKDTYNTYFTGFELAEKPITLSQILNQMWEISGLSNITNRGYAVDDDFFNGVRKVKVFALSTGWTGR